MDANNNPLLRSPQSDEEPYATISSAPPKRRAGRTKFRETRHPVFKGVRRRNADRWVCEVREPNKKSRIWLGTFPTAEMAARAHDVAAMALRGRSACLNFADSAWLLPVPESSSPKDIQKAAVQAAEAFRPAEHSSSANSTNATEMPTQGIAEEFPFGNEEYHPDMVDFGWMSPPPALPSTSYGMGSDYGGFWDENDGVEVSLWSYSI